MIGGKIISFNYDFMENLKFEYEDYYSDLSKKLKTSSNHQRILINVPFFIDYVRLINQL